MGKMVFGYYGFFVTRIIRHTYESLKYENIELVEQILYTSSCWVCRIKSDKSFESVTNRSLILYSFCRTKVKNFV